MNYEKRMKHFRKYMEEKGIDAVFLPSCGDRQYLTGIPSERPCSTHHHRSGDWLDGLFLTESRAVFTSPWMLRAHYGKEVSERPWIEELIIMDEGKEYRDYLRAVFEKLAIPSNGTIGFPKQTMGKTIINFLEVFPELKAHNIEECTTRMRMIKDEDEIAIMREASRIIDEAFLDTIKIIHPGVTEYEIAMEIEYQIKLRGAEGVSFPTDVMCTNPGQKEMSPGSSLLKVQPGSNIAFDIGAIYNGYCSDFGRTVYVGEPSHKYCDVHNLVMRSQQAAVEAIAAGPVTCYELDCIARKVINDGGYYEEFFHRLGHNIGIDVHEYPYLNKYYNEMLQKGMTLTIEPSVLIPGELRIRVEDIFLIGDHKAESINHVTHDMIVIDA